MAGRTDPDDCPTEQSRSLVKDVLALLRRHAEQQRRLSLVVHHREGTERAALDPGVPVVVGRTPPATLLVPSTKLSRAHARFTLDPLGFVVVEDLGSTNGTWIDGARVSRAEIEPGTEVILGNALALVEVTAPDQAAVRPGESTPDGPIAVSASMRAVLDMAARVAASAVPVILQGETGAGKEVVARFLHDHSPRAHKPMVSVNCAAIPAQLVESTLFGYEKGAFTGAAQRQKGVFEEADGGTVFLDEIGELGLPAQAALLRVLETGRFARVGSPKEIAVDVRVVGATHRNLEALRDAGQFRADLYYRLSVMVLQLPALRDRPEDIEPLCRRFLAQGAGAGGRARDISPAALACLRAYAFPGNVRELRNTLDRASILARGSTIGEEDLPDRIRMAAAAAPPPPPPPRWGMATIPPGSMGATNMGEPAAGAPSVGDLRARMQEIEATTIRQMLESVGWNQSEAARRLGMPIRTLSNKVKSLGIKRG
ncbi:MAG: sigma 54-interacting transcriptional regulator [Byssovorax sp.]